MKNNIITNYFRSQFKEIENDAALRLYGIFLAFAHVLTYFFWHTKGYYNRISNEIDPICWPFWENCFRYRFFDAGQVDKIFHVFGAMSLLSLVFFLPRNRVKPAYLWLLAANVLKMLITIQDYRMRANQYYMLFFASFVYLFLPDKRNLVRVTLVLFYFWAGTLKFNYEWLSGQGLYADPWLVPKPLIQASCMYVVFLECLIVFGVLFRNTWIYWLTLAQLILFHIASWGVVKYYYPMLMLSLLTIFPLTRFIPHSNEPESLIRSLLRLRQPASTYVFIIVFSGMNLIPKLIPGDETLTREGRLFGLHMFDTLVNCEGGFTVKFKDSSAKEIPIREKGFVPRSKCDPLMTFANAKYQCYKYRNDPSFVDIDVTLRVQRSYERVMYPLVNVENFCTQNLHYNMLGHNAWIRLE